VIITHFCYYAYEIEQPTKKKKKKTNF